VIGLLVSLINKDIIPGFIVFIFGLMILFPAYLFYILRSIVYRNSILIDKNIEISFEKSGIKIKSEVVNQQTPWSSFIKWRVNDTILLLYYTPNAAICFPRIAVAYDED